MSFQIAGLDRAQTGREKGRFNPMVIFESKFQSIGLSSRVAVGYIASQDGYPKIHDGFKQEHPVEVSTGCCISWLPG